MPSSSLSSSSATVVELAGFRTTDKAKKDQSKKVVATGSQAQMLSMRQHLHYQASVEIDNLERIKQEFGTTYCSNLGKHIRHLLNKEFGQLRVHRYRRLYVIRHRSVEGLISSLLRIQFHAQQLDLPLLTVSGDASATKSVTLTWGVGRTTLEAEVERLRRRRQKYKR